MYETWCCKSCVIQSLPLDSIRSIHPGICQFGIPMNNHIDDSSQSTLQHTATHCNAPPHPATHCNTLQHTYINLVYLEIISYIVPPAQFNIHHTSFYTSFATQSLARFNTHRTSLRTAHPYAPHILTHRTSLYTSSSVQYISYIILYIICDTIATAIPYTSYGVALVSRID